MSTCKVDSKKRIVLPSGEPGEVYAVRRQDGEHLLLVRLTPPKRAPRLDKQACLDALEVSPLHPRMKWEQLRQLTRES